MFRQRVEPSRATAPAGNGSPFTSSRGGSPTAEVATAMVARKLKTGRFMHSSFPKWLVQLHGREVQFALRPVVAQYLRGDDAVGRKQNAEMCCPVDRKELD